MAFAQGSRSRLTFAKETTFGTAPSDLTVLPINTHSLNLTKAVVTSGEIRSDRQVAVERHGNKSVSGEIPVEFRADDYDELLEGVFFNEFDTAQELTLGTTLQTFTFEDGAIDIDQYRLFTGCALNTFALSVRPNEIVTATFGVVGKSQTISGTSQDATPTAASSNSPFDSFTGTITIESSASAIITGIDLNIENGVQPTFVIGDDETPQLEYGRARVSGTITAYYEDATLLNYFVNETEIDLEFSLTDGVTGNTYTFDMPRVKFNGGDVPLENEQSRIINIPFTALYSSSDTYALKLTKS